MKLRKDIMSFDKDGQTHGYSLVWNLNGEGVSYRGMRWHGTCIKYQEWHPDPMFAYLSGRCSYYIR